MTTTPARIDLGAKRPNAPLCDGRARRDPQSRHVRFGAPDRPEDDLPRLGSRADAAEHSLGALFGQSYDLCFHAPKDILIVTLKAYDSVHGIDGERPRTVRVQPGLALWFPAHRLIQAGAAYEEAEFAGVSIAPALKQECAEQMRLGVRPRASLGHFSATGGSRLLMRAAQRIRNAAMVGFAIDAMAKDQLCIDLTRAFLAALARDPDAGDVGARLSDKQLSTAVDVIEAHKTEDLTMRTVAQACGVSQPHLTAGFKLATGLTPYQYLIERRLAEVRRRLLTTNETAAEIALACGFSSQAHMTHLFGRKCGVTPARLRKRRGSEGPPPRLH